MDVKIAGQSDNMLRLEIEGGNHEILHLLVSKLLKDSDVSFAAYKKEHELFNKYSLVLRTKKRKAKLVFDQAAKELGIELEDFKKELVSKVK